jgi:TPR repeat protein
MSEDNERATESYSLPFRATLGEYQQQAERLYDALQAGDDDARWNFKWMHPRYRGKSVRDVDAATLLDPAANHFRRTRT